MRLSYSPDPFARHQLCKASNTNYEKCVLSWGKFEGVGSVKNPFQRHQEAHQFSSRTYGDQLRVDVLIQKLNAHGLVVACKIMVRM